MWEYNMRKRTQIYLDKADFNQLRHLAISKECSFSELIRQIIKSYLEKETSKDTILS